MKTEAVVTFEKKEIVDLILAAARRASGISDGGGTVEIISHGGGGEAWSCVAKLQMTSRLNGK